MAPVLSGKGKESGAARILGSGTSGSCFNSYYRVVLLDVVDSLMNSILL